MTKTALIFVVLSLMASIVVAADKQSVNKSDSKTIYELQEKCAESCKNYTFEEVTGYECHYNVKLNKCFVVIYFHTPTGGHQWRQLIDIHENQIYDEVSSSDYRVCDTYKFENDIKGETRCIEEINNKYDKEIIKFNKRIKSYMTE